MSEESRNYDISDVETVRSLKAEGINIPFNRIASTFVNKVSESESDDQDIIDNYFFIKIKLIDGNGGFTQQDENVSFLIEKSKFHKFEKDYDEWIKEIDEKLSKQSFYGGEKKHFEQVVKSISTKLVQEMKEQYKSIIQKQELESKKRIEEIEKDSKKRIQELEDSAKDINRMQLEVIQENKKLQARYVEMQEKAEKAMNTVNAFFTDLTEIQEENENLKSDLEVKRALKD